MNINDTSIVLDELAGYSKNGGYKPLQDRLMKKVANAKSVERIDYLRKDSEIGVSSLNGLIKNMRLVQSGTPSRYLSDKSVELIKKDIAMGNTPEEVEKYINWIKTVYRPAMTEKRKQLVAEGKAGKHQLSAKASRTFWDGMDAYAKMLTGGKGGWKKTKSEGCEVGMNNPMGFAPEFITEGVVDKMKTAWKNYSTPALYRGAIEEVIAGDKRLLERCLSKDACKVQLNRCKRVLSEIKKTKATLKKLKNDKDYMAEYGDKKKHKYKYSINDPSDFDAEACLFGGCTEQDLDKYIKFLDTEYPKLYKEEIKRFDDYIMTESVAPRNIFYRMTESEMFMTANRMAKINGQEVVDILPRVAVEGQGFAHVGMNDLDSTVVYELFESNRFKLSCKQQMKKLLAGGDVVLVYGDEYRIPTCIPFVIQSKGRNAATVFVNITPFTSINKNGKIVVTQIRNYSGLMAVVFAGCVAYETIRGGGSLPADLADALVLFYAGMMTKVINGLVHADSIQKETCKYLCAEFALVQMYGTEKGTTIFQRFKNKYFPKLGNLVVNSIDDTFHIDSFDNMTLFVEELKKNYPIMKGLSVPAISERWMRSFGSATALSLDYLGFHLYTLCMLLFESPLVSRMALEPLIDQKLGSNAFKRMQIMIEG